MRRNLESYIIYLKEDLKLADTLRTAKEKLLKSIRDEGYFSEDLALYFIPGESNYFTIPSSDPSQVALLKKILNSLENAERALREIEDLNIDPERGGLLFNAAKWIGLGEAAKTAEIAAQVVKIYYYKINEVYAALQLLNHANADIQNIVGPHLQAFIPRLALAQTKLDEFNSSSPVEGAGELLAGLVSDLPREKQGTEQSKEAVSQWIVNLPQQFQRLQSIFAQASSSSVRSSQSESSGEEYQKAMLKKANEGKLFFDQLIARKEGLAGTSSTVINYFKLMSELALHSAKLIQSAPINQQTYLNAVDQLNLLKHHYFPQLIAQLELVEESMALKPGLLTEPTLLQMEKYYSQLASMVQSTALTAGIIDKKDNANLLQMADKKFTEARREFQEQRLRDAQSEAGNKEIGLAAKSFFDRLYAYNTINKALCKWSLANVSQKEKDDLIDDYKQIQSYFVAVYPEIDELIVKSLNWKTSDGFFSRLFTAEYKQLVGSDHFSTVLACRAEVEESIQQGLAQAQFKARLIETTIRHSEPGQIIPALIRPNLELKSEEALSLEKKKRKDTPLVVKAAELEKRTLFAMLHDLKLSKSLDNFIKGNLQSYLEAHLSPLLWKELARDGKLDLSKLPYTNLHQDSSDIVLYKQLINSIFYLQQGLKELEEINNKDPKNLITRSRYLFAMLNTLSVAINNSNHYLSEAARNPGLNAIVQESNALLEPIKSLPFVGDYLRSARFSSVEDEIGIIELWNKQQAIVKKARSSLPTPTIDKSIKESPKAVSENTYLHVMAKALCQIPQALDKFSHLNPRVKLSAEQEEEQIQVFVENLKALSFDPASKEQLLAATAKLQKRLNEIGALGHDAVMTNLKEIRSEFGFIFMAAAAKAEFELGLKPGTYSAVVNEHFDRFYSALISNLPLKRDQTGLELIIDVSHTRKLLDQEKERLSKSKADNTAQLTEDFLFGDNFTSERALYQAYRELNELHNTYINPANQYEVIDYDDFRFQVSKVYERLQPILVQSKAEFTQNFIENAEGEGPLLTALEQIFAARFIVLQPTAPLAKLFQFALDDDFAKKEVQEEFLLCYQQLQPYLFKINPEYNKTYFLRELQNPEDFVAAVHKILSEEDHLKELVTGIEKTQQNKVRLAQERVLYVQAVLKSQIEVIGPKKIAAFKEKVYDNYLKANVESFLALSLGDEQAALFVKHAMTDFQGMKSEILQHADISGNIELSIATAIDYAVAKTVEDNRKSFKDLLFKSYVEKDLINQLDKGLGRYKDLFFQNINSAYYLQQERILTDLALDKDLSKKIALELDIVHAQLLEQNKVLHHDFIDLNLFAENLTHRISKEKTLEQTPERLETLGELELLLHSIEASKIDSSNPSKNLKQAKIELSLILYNSHLHTIKAKFNEQLGDYTELFFKKVQHVYEKNKSSIIQKTMGAEQIDECIISALAALTVDIERQAHALKAAFIELNAFSGELNKLLVQEEANPDNNPCRTKKIELLQKLKAFIHEVPELQNIDSSWVNNKHKKALGRLDLIQEYDALLQINELLNLLKVNITNEESDPKAKESKIKMVIELQQGLYDENIEVTARLNTVIGKLTQHSQANLLSVAGNDLIAETFKNYFFQAQLRKEKEKLNSVLGPFTERFMTVMNEELLLHKMEIKAEITVGMTSDKVEAIFAPYLLKLLANHKELYDLCSRLNTRLNHLDKLIAQEIGKWNLEEGAALKENPCHNEKLAFLTRMRNGLSEAALANESVDILRNKLRAVEKVNVSARPYQQLTELYTSLHSMQACVAKTPESPLKDQKLAELELLKKIISNNEPTGTRLQAICEQSKTSRKILAQSADGFFMNLLKTFLALINKILRKEPSLEEKIAIKYQSNLSLFKEKIDDIKNENNSQKNNILSKRL